MPLSVKPCKHCGGVSHQSWKCRWRVKSETVQVRLVKKGKVGKQWDKTRAKWFRDNPQDMYECYLKISPRCPGWMYPHQTTLDHIKSRSRYPELRFVQSNLAPCCWWCNRQKGSRDVTQVKGQ